MFVSDSVFLVVNFCFMYIFFFLMFILVNIIFGNFMVNFYEKMIINSIIDKKNSLGVGWGWKDFLLGF